MEALRHPGRRTLSLVVPLFNEEERVQELGPQLLEFVGRHPTGSQLIFVDDGSTDDPVLVPGVSDTQCGAKAARHDVWRQLLADSCEDGFAWDVEVVALARQLGIDVREVPVDWRHDDRSRVRVARDGVAMLRAIPRIRSR